MTTLRQEEANRAAHAAAEAAQREQAERAEAERRKNEEAESANAAKERDSTMPRGGGSLSSLAAHMEERRGGGT